MKVGKKKGVSGDTSYIVNTMTACLKFFTIKVKQNLLKWSICVANNKSKLI